MLRYLFITTILLLPLAAFAQYDPARDTQERLAAQAEILLDEAILAEDFVGVSAGIFFQDAVYWQSGAGYLDRAEQTPATADMIHRLASISKPMTAVAILQLAAAGKLELDVPIQRYLPEFPKKPEGPITIRQLLNHTSGIPAYKSAREFTTQTHYSSQSAAMTFFQDRPLRFAPGTDYSYTTYGYTVLGAIIERVTGTAFAEYMRSHVWQPAGMLHTGVETHGFTDPQKSSLYRKDKRGDFAPDTEDNLSIKYPGGGMQSTVGDLLAFGQAILDHELLSPADFERMRATPALEHDGTPYGLGWFVVDDPDHGRIVRHGGAQSGTSTFLEIYLDQRLVVAVLANTAGVDMEVGALKDKLARLVLDPTYLAAPIPRIVELDQDQLDRFTGIYRFPSGSEIKIFRKGDQLWSRIKDIPDIRIFPASAHELFYRVFEDRLTLELANDGSIQGVTHRANGKEQAVNKVK